MRQAGAGSRRRAKNNLQLLFDCPAARPGVVARALVLLLLADEELMIVCGSTFATLLLLLVYWWCTVATE